MVNWLGEVEVRPVRGVDERRRWDALMRAHHYLPFRGRFGKSLRQVAVRDGWIEWTRERPFARLHLVANHVRFAVLPAGRVLGRSLRRRCVPMNCPLSATPEPRPLPAVLDLDGLGWDGFARLRERRQAFRIERERHVIKQNSTSRETVYGLTLLDTGRAGPAETAALVRHHREIENRRHYVRDFTYDEDRCRVHVGNLPPTSPTVPGNGSTTCHRSGRSLPGPAPSCPRLPAATPAASRCRS